VIKYLTIILAIATIGGCGRTLPANAWDGYSEKLASISPPHAKAKDYKGYIQIADARIQGEFLIISILIDTDAKPAEDAIRRLDHLSGEPIGLIVELSNPSERSKAKMGVGVRRVSMDVGGGDVYRRLLLKCAIHRQNVNRERAVRLRKSIDAVLDEDSLRPFDIDEQWIAVTDE
jgi:hypothetical protein